MKKSILLLLVLAGTALAGCVHPTDLNTIAPAATSTPSAD
jgi:outer membrane murein-binding lipoprotein Lpp